MAESLAKARIACAALSGRVDDCMNAHYRVLDHMEILVRVDDIGIALDFWLDDFPTYRTDVDSEDVWQRVLQTSETCWKIFKDEFQSLLKEPIISEDSIQRRISNPLRAVEQAVHTIRALTDTLMEAPETALVSQDSKQVASRDATQDNAVEASIVENTTTDATSADASVLVDEFDDPAGTRSITIHNLTRHTKDSTLDRVFSEFGPVKVTERGGRFAVMTFSASHKDSVDEAIAAMRRAELDGRKIWVHLAEGRGGERCHLAHSFL